METIKEIQIMRASVGYRVVAIYRDHHGTDRTRTMSGCQTHKQADNEAIRISRKYGARVIDLECGRGFVPA
jgi:uncharacterized FAD-dependent dehydrogenase